MKKDTLTQQQVTLLLDLVQDALLANDGKFGPLNQAWNDDLRDVRDTLEDM